MSKSKAKTCFVIACKKHGKAIAGSFRGVTEEVIVGSKTKDGCPLCRKEK